MIQHWTENTIWGWWVRLVVEGGSVDFPNGLWYCPIALNGRKTSLCVAGGFQPRSPIGSPIPRALPANPALKLVRLIHFRKWDWHRKACFLFGWSCGFVEQDRWKKAREALVAHWEAEPFGAGFWSFSHQKTCWQLKLHSLFPGDWGRNVYFYWKGLKRSLFYCKSNARSLFKKERTK